MSKNKKEPVWVNAEAKGLEPQEPGFFDTLDELDTVLDETNAKVDFPQPDMQFFSVSNGKGGWRKSVLTVKDGKVVGIETSEPDMMQITIDGYKKEFVCYWNRIRSKGVVVG